MTAALASLELQDALLVGGDISGVQDFIYTISADGAASALRGRSFYLQLLNEILPRLILDELHLPLTNLIYTGGGNFYLLVHASDQKKLDILRERISRILWAHHCGELYLALASLPSKKLIFLKAKSPSVGMIWAGYCNAPNSSAFRNWETILSKCLSPKTRRER